MASGRSEAAPPHPRGRSRPPRASPHGPASATSLSALPPPPPAPRGLLRGPGGGSGGSKRPGRVGGSPQSPAGRTGAAAGRGWRRRAADGGRGRRRRPTHRRRKMAEKEGAGRAARGYGKAAAAGWRERPGEISREPARPGREAAAREARPLPIGREALPGRGGCPRSHGDRDAAATAAPKGQKKRRCVSAGAALERGTGHLLPAAKARSSSWCTAPPELSQFVRCSHVTCSIPMAKPQRELTPELTPPKERTAPAVTAPSEPAPARGRGASRAPSTQPQPPLPFDMPHFFHQQLVPVNQSISQINLCSSDLLQDSLTEPDCPQPRGLPPVLINHRWSYSLTALPPAAGAGPTLPGAVQISGRCCRRTQPRMGLPHDTNTTSSSSSSDAHTGFFVWSQRTSLEEVSSYSVFAYSTGTIHQEFILKQ